MEADLGRVMLTNVNRGRPPSSCWTMEVPTGMFSVIS
jgi:hypothetical protein